MIEASVQTSRFAPKQDIGVDLQGVSVSVAGKDLLVDASVQLKPGAHYGLLGRNGVGKSILLNCLAGGTLFSPSLRKRVRVMLVGQTLAMSSDHRSLEEDDPRRTVLEELERQPFLLREGMTEREELVALAEQQSRTRGKAARTMLSALQVDDEHLLDMEDLLDMGEEPPDPSAVREAAKSMGLDESLWSRPYITLSGQRLPTHARERTVFAHWFFFPPNRRLAHAGSTCQSIAL